MVGLADQGLEWTRGSDGDVRAALAGELARLDDADPFAVLGVDYQADDDEVRAAFLTATKILHPNRFARRDTETRRIANEVYLRVKAAYDRVQDPAVRKRLASRLGVGSSAEDMVAEEQPEATPTAQAPSRPRSLAARRRVAARRVASDRRRGQTTPESVQKRVAEREGAIEADYEAAKALMQQGKLVEGRDAFRKLAVAHTNDRRFRTWMHYSMGRVYASEGDNTRAGDEYRRALATEPSFDLARRALDQLPPPSDDTPPAPRKGLFSRLFKK